MTLLVYALGADGQVLPGRTLRNTAGAPYLPGPGVTAVSGVLAGPPNTMGELSLAAGVITVQPFKAVIQCSQDASAGQFVVTNDAALPLTALTAQSATQYRRGLVVIDVDDSQVAGVASSGTTDRVRVYPLDGGLAASAGAAALPALPDNSLALGEYLIPPTGQAVTLTPYNPRTSVRGGILPVIADSAAIPGHDGLAPAYDGQARWHPTRGLEFGVGGVWGPSAASPISVTEIGPLLSGTYQTSAASYPFRALLFPGGRVVLTGAFTNAGGTFAANAGTVYNIFGAGKALPAALRPPYTRRVAVAVATGTSYSTALLVINTDGTISYVPQAALSAGFLVHGDGATYLTAN